MSKKQKGTDRLLTGKELKIAAEKKLPVRYVESYLNPEDDHMNYDDVCVMEPANMGFYIGNSDIQPNDFKDGQTVSGEFDEGSYGVYAVEGVEYK